MALSSRLLVDLCLIAPMVGFAVALYYATFTGLDPTDPEEKWELVVRACALFLGGFIVLASQFSGLNFSQFIVKSLSGLKPVTIGLFGLLPGVGGVAVSWFMVRSIKRKTGKGVRVLALVGMLAIIQFIQLLFLSAGEKHYSFGPLYSANSAFVVGILLYLVIWFNPKAHKKPTSVPWHLPGR